MVGPTWDVVGGGDKGGILVRVGSDLSSAPEAERLSTGARVRELASVGDRIQYELLTGSGPASGWVSIRLKDRDLLVRSEAPGPSPAQPPGTRPSGVAVVTGANKGIGYETARKLLGAGLRVVAACRSSERGVPAAKQIGAEFELLDVDSEASIGAFVQRMSARHGRLDVLVNNAATIGVPSTPFAARTKPTLRTNFYGLVSLTDSLLPLLRESATSGGHPRIVNLGSERAGRSQLRADLASEFASPTLDRKGLFGLVQKFEADVRAGRHNAEGWGDSNYGFSKLAVVAYTKVVAREEGAAMKVNAADPGYCVTDMTENLGDRSAEVGARTSAMLALLPDSGPTGEFFRDERKRAW